MSGLAISTLSLSYFRNHRATRLQFDGRPVAIIGPNGAGKTNILEAVSLFSPGRGLRRAPAEALARRPEAIGWKITAGVEGLAGGHDLETWSERGEARQVRVDGKPATQVMLGRILRILWLVPAMDRLWIEAAEGRRRFLDRMTLSFFPEHAEASLGYDKAMRERNRLLKDEVRDPHWYGAVEARMAETGARVMAHRAATLQRLRQAQQGAATAFPQADLMICAPDAAGEEGSAPGIAEGAEIAGDLVDGLAGDLAAAWAEGRRRDMAAGRSLLGPHRADLRAVYAVKGVAAEQCSTGEQKALLLSLILANARALAEDLGRAPVLLLDEVAAHLDSARRAALYDEILALGAQALMTGTEAALFDSLAGRAQIFDLDAQGAVEGGV